MEALRFFAAELETHRPGGAAPGVGQVVGAAPIGEAPPARTTAADTAPLRASDLGWVTPANDPAGASLVYPPVLSSAFAVDRTLDLSLDGAGAGVAWGGLRFQGSDKSFSGTGSERNVDSRPVRILLGRKPRDSRRGIWTNPPRSAMTQLFVGLAREWRPDEDGLTVPVRDATLWLERQLQVSTYLGTGKEEGTVELTGRPKPKLRGGLLGASVRNISPILIDPPKQIYQFSDGPATIDGSAGVFENGAAVFTDAGTSTDLWNTSTPAGAFRQDTSRGLLQLGSTPAGQITINAVGSIPGWGYSTTSSAAVLALQMMRFDLSVPAENIDADSFNALAAPFNHAAGWFWDGSEGATGADAIGLLIAGLGARIIPARDGRLRAMAFRAPGGVAVASYGPDEIVAVQRLPLPEGLSPPPYRIRVGHTRNFTVMGTSQISATQRGTVREQFLKHPERYESWGSTAVVNAYRRPSDPEPISTPLLTIDGARAMAQILGNIWGLKRYVYRVELPLDLGLVRDLGNIIRLTYPVEGLEDGASAVIIGESFRSTDDTIVFSVLV